MKDQSLSFKHGERRRRTAVRIVRALRMFRMWDLPPEEARQNAEHMKMCSCWMCGNFRRTLGPTLQEKRADLALRDEF